MLGPERISRIFAGLLLSLVAACSLFGTSLDRYTAADSSCSANEIACAERCVDSTSNVANCGSCGHACAGGESCVAGECKIACPGGQIACGTLCYDSVNDPRHCGGCSTTCKPGEVCGDSKCGSTCPAGQTNCSGSCANVQTDSMHCGDCNTVCGPNDECLEGKCVVACKTQLNQPITDPWGLSWDGLERATASWGTAAPTCEAFRGRLPTASELHRVSATQSATVGQTVNTNILWSIVPTSPTAHAIVRLSDSATNRDEDTAKYNYRCVCPPPAPKPYIAANCNGPVGAGCIPLIEENQRHHLDAKDRPPLTKGAAAWECAFYHGRLATPIRLTEAIQNGIPTGNDVWLHTGDEVNYQSGLLLRWSDGTNFAFQHGASNSVTWDVTTSFRPFRCSGVNYSPDVPASTSASEWVSPTSGRKSETTDSAEVTITAAMDECWNRGGHLPTSNELGELIGQGLPGGSGKYLWTSDEVGSDSAGFLVAVRRWNGADRLIPSTYQSDFSWAYKATTYKNPFRCIHYPIDAAFAAPPAMCAGGCTTVNLPGTSGAKMWFDAIDRAPAASATAAIDACRKERGHLPTPRDFTEAIRHGLPNGGGAYLLTSDLAVGDGASNTLFASILKWTATEPTFENQSATGAGTWSPPQNPLAYRCMWTNELR